MAKPFPDMDYWGAFMAMGPAPLGNASQAAELRQHPLSNGPYKIENVQPSEELTLVKNDQWDPDSDPASSPVRRQWVFKFDQDQAQVDQIMLSGNTDSQTAIATVARLGQVRAGQRPTG